MVLMQEQLTRLSDENQKLRSTVNKLEGSLYEAKQTEANLARDLMQQRTISSETLKSLEQIVS